MLRLGEIIVFLYPNAQPRKDFDVRDESDGNGPYIYEWNVKDEQGNDVPEPSEEELHAAWDELQKQPSKPTEKTAEVERDNAILLTQIAEMTAQNEQQAGDMAFILMRNAELEAQLAQTSQEQAALLIELTTKGVL